MSILGRPIRAIGDIGQRGVDEGEPEILIMGAHHAREIMSVEVPLLFAKYLLASYGTDPAVTALVDTRAVWIVPMVNVDGHILRRAESRRLFGQLVEQEPQAERRRKLRQSIPTGTTATTGDTTTRELARNR